MGFLGEMSWKDVGIARVVVVVVAAAGQSCLSLAASKSSVLRPFRPFDPEPLALRDESPWVCPLA